MTAKQFNESVNAEIRSYTATQVCNAGDWPTEEDHQRYWQERGEHLDRIESNALWFDNKAKNERHPFA